MINAPMALPYPLTSRQVLEPLDTQAFTFGGQPLTWNLTRVGFLEGLLIHVTGTQTVVTGSPAPKAFFPYNLLKRIVFDTPGLQDPIGISGDSLHAQNLVAHDFSLMGNGGDAPASPNAFDVNAFYLANIVDLFPVAVAANQVRLTYFLPVRRNIADLRGVVPLGNRQQSRLRITPATAAELFATTANISTTSLNVQVTQVFRTAPPAGMPAPEYEASHAIVLDEYEQSVTATGQNKFEIPTGGIILNILQRIAFVDTTNPMAPEGSLDDVSLWLNRDKVADRVPARTWFIMQNAGRPQVIPAGTVLHDFDARGGEPPYVVGGEARTPGWVYSDELNELTAFLGVTAGTTLTNAKVVTSVKRLVKL